MSALGDPATAAAAVAQGAQQNQLQSWAVDAANAAAKQYGLDPAELVPTFMALINQESGWDPNAVNPISGASGLGQIMPQYHPGVDYFDPQANLNYSADYLAQNIRRYGGDYLRGVAAYNWGPGNVDAHAQLDDASFIAAAPQETQNYVQSILGMSDPTDPNNATQPPGSTGGDPYSSIWVDQQQQQMDTLMMQATSGQVDPTQALASTLQPDPYGEAMDDQLMSQLNQGGSDMALTGPYGNTGQPYTPQFLPNLGGTPTPTPGGGGLPPGTLPGSGTPVPGDGAGTGAGGFIPGTLGSQLYSNTFGGNQPSVTGDGLPNTDTNTGLQYDPNTLTYTYNGQDTGATTPTQAKAWMQAMGLLPQGTTGTPSADAANLARSRANYYDQMGQYRQFMAQTSILNAFERAQQAADTARQNARMATISASPLLVSPGQSPFVGGFEPNGAMQQVANFGGYAFTPMRYGTQQIDLSGAPAQPDPTQVARINKLLGVGQ